MTKKTSIYLSENVIKKLNRNTINGTKRINQIIDRYCYIMGYHKIDNYDPAIVDIIAQSFDPLESKSIGNIISNCTAKQREVLLSLDPLILVSIFEMIEERMKL